MQKYKYEMGLKIKEVYKKKQTTEVINMNDKRFTLLNA